MACDGHAPADSSRGPARAFWQRIGPGPFHVDRHVPTPDSAAALGHEERRRRGTCSRDHGSVRDQGRGRRVPLHAWAMQRLIFQWSSRVALCKRIVRPGKPIKHLCIPLPQNSNRNKAADGIRDATCHSCIGASHAHVRGIPSLRVLNGQDTRTTDNSPSLSPHISDDLEQVLSLLQTLCDMSQERNTCAVRRAVKSPAHMISLNAVRPEVDKARGQWSLEALRMGATVWGPWEGGNDHSTGHSLDHE